MAKIWVSIAFIFFAVCANLPAQTAPQLAQNTFPSVVMIVTSDANGQPLALGSGFSVGDAVIATNMHVIEGASAARIKVIGRPETYTVGGVIGTDPTADLALLKVNGLNAPPLQLGDSKQAAVGDQVFAVGNPEGLEGTFSEGIVSGIRTVDADTLLQITAPISPGSSGGPVIDSNGKVLGIAVATFKEGQNLNFAVPVSYLKALLAQDAGAKIRPLAGIA
ncbi:MAG: trypsin-like peptidase domain-containing protein, partial [Candidatus Acidiferrales bacterium]